MWNNGLLECVYLCAFYSLWNEMEVNMWVNGRFGAAQVKAQVSRLFEWVGVV